MAEKEWFTDWFDSSYYHLLYQHRDENEAEKFLASLVAEINLPKGMKVLDVACGRGRHAKILQKFGFDVTGIDLSENNIAFARQFENEHLHFVRWDMRHTFRPAYFDAAVNLFSSFGYLPSDEDNLLALKAIAANLKPNGVLVLDYMNAEWVVKHMKHREIIQRGNIQFHIQKKVSNGLVVKTIQFLNEEGTNFEFEEKLRIIHLQTFQKLCKDAALVIENVWGDYDLQSFHAASSPRIILRCRKL